MNTIAVPQLSELVAPDFFVHFMKNIGHDGSLNRPGPPPGPNCAVTYRCGAPKAKPKAAIVNISEPYPFLLFIG